MKVWNRLVLEGTEEMKEKVMKELKNPDMEVGSMDFNAITPMPAWVSCAFDASKEKLRSASLHYRDILSQRAGWEEQNWGVVTNALPAVYKHDPDTIDFLTKDKNVLTLMRRMAWLYPEIIFTYQYALETPGHYVGEFKLKGFDVLKGEVYADGSEEAKRLHLHLWN